MSELSVSSVRGRRKGVTPTLPDGAVVTGVTTSTSFAGNLTGNVTGIATGNVTGNVTGNISGTTGSFTGNVSVGGTLTYEDVTNVDSVGVITARDGIKVGAGQSISAVSGTVTYYGDGSQLEGVQSGRVDFVASGNIGNGDTVIIKADGTVGVVTSSTTFPSTTTYGTATEIADNVWFNEGVYVGSGKIVVCYVDVGDTDKGKAVVGTISGTSISFGSPVTYSTGNNQTAQPSIVYNTNLGKIVISYRDYSNSNRGTVVVGEVSGTSITFGSPYVFRTTETRYTQLSYDPNSQKIVAFYRADDASNIGKARVLTPHATSNTIDSVGTEVSFTSTSIGNDAMEVAYDANAGKHVVYYADGAVNMKVATVNGTNVSFGSELEVLGMNPNGGTLSITYDASVQKVVATYGHQNDNKGYVVVGTINGTNISVGSATAVVDDYFYEGYIIYDAAAQKNLVSYRNHSQSSRGESKLITVSGTSVSNIGSATIFSTDGTVNYLHSVYDSQNEKVIVSYKTSTSNKGYSSVGSSKITTTNLTSENYIGIAAEAISDGATGKINVPTGINQGQTGLTTARTYYVQIDGTLSTSAGSPSVVAGKAISSTKILVQ